MKSKEGEEAISYIADKEILTSVILLIFIALMVVEKYWAYRHDQRGMVRRSYAVNLKIFLWNDALLGLMSVSSLVAVADGYSGFGLLSIVSDPLMKAFASFVMLDLVLYWWHRARHEYPILWKFHKVHHSDVVMNTTTTFRLHFVEVALTVLVKAVFIVVFGVPAALVLLNESIITAFVLLSHTNIRFPGEKLASKVFIVPCKHASHHSVLGSEQHRNFGFALSVWDRWFGTCVKTVPQSFGLFRVEEQGFFDTILLRFVKKQ